MVILHYKWETYLIIEVMPIEHINLVMDVIEQITEILPLHMFVGNHDLWTKSTSTINAMRPFKHMSNVFVYDNLTRFEYNGLNLLFMPYVNNRREQIAQIQSNKDCHYLFVIQI